MRRGYAVALGAHDRVDILVWEAPEPLKLEEDVLSETMAKH
jgi:hypothetical protein